MKNLRIDAFLTPAARKWVAIGLTDLAAMLLSVWIIYGVQAYGIALFFLLPLFIGAAPVLLYGYAEPVGRRQAMKIGLWSAAVFLAGLVLFAMEGLICIAMALPLVLPLVIGGSLMGYLVAGHLQNRSAATFLLLLLLSLVPLTAAMDHRAGTGPALTPVVTSVVIEADRATVWENVIAFPALDAPGEWIFRAGIAYPTDATITGSGVGAVRRCNFSTGAFVEPITGWREHELLAFDVESQPPPLQEVTLWDAEIPHLNDYFQSVRGDFRLIRISENRTRLVGTTWYRNRVRPAAFWKLWSDYIVHTIHRRVLQHIKATAEEHPGATQ